MLQPLRPQPLIIKYFFEFGAQYWYQLYSLKKLEISNKTKKKNLTERPKES